MFNKMNLDKIKGAFYGGVLGDALGMPFEFVKHVSRIRETYNGSLIQTIHHSRFQGTRKYQIGQFSDDSEMMLTIIECLYKHSGVYNRDKITMSYITWANTEHCFFMGKNTRYLFKGIKSLRGYQNRYDKIKVNNDIQSNGALMRCFPLVFFDDHVAREDCEITNPNVVSIYTNILFLNALRSALNGQNKIDIYRDLCNEASKAGISVIIDAVKDAWDVNNTRDITHNKGWCCHTLYCAIWSLMNFNSYDQAINNVIIRGGDTDTNACVAGYLNGAYYGFSSLSAKEKDNLRVLFECDTTKGDCLRPEPYRGVCLDTVFEHLIMILS